MGVRLRKLGKGGNYFAICYDGSRQPKEKSWPLKTKRKDVALVRYGQFVEKYERGKIDPWDPAQAPAKKMTVEEAKTAFLNAKRHLRKRSVETYNGVLTRFLRRLPPNLMLSHVSADHVSAFVHDPEVERATQVKRYTNVGVFVRWAKKEGLIERNPLDDVRRPKEERRLPSYLSPADLDHLIETIEKDYAAKVDPTKGHKGSIIWLRDAVLLAASTGLRRGELLNLHWSDVDTEGRWLHVRNREDFRTKSGDERSVPLVPTALEALERLRAERDGEAYGPVLRGKKGGPLNGNQFTRRFKHYVREAKLNDRLREHDLRHTCGAWLAQQGVSLQIIAAILGHSDTRITERHYAHLHRDTLKKAMEETFG